MKPRIKVFRTARGALKWQCTSDATGVFGWYQRIGVGYTPAEAYRKWSRCP